MDEHDVVPVEQPIVESAPPPVEEAVPEKGVLEDILQMAAAVVEPAKKPRKKAAKKAPKKAAKKPAKKAAKKPAKKAAKKPAKKAAKKPAKKAAKKPAKK